MNDFEKVLYYYGFLDLEEVQNKYKIICPFHEDLNPSMIVDLDSQRYYCFGCGAKGNTIDFIMHIEKTDILSANLKLKQIKNKTARKKIQIRVRAPDIMQEEAIENAKKEYQDSKVIDWTNLSEHYLMNRGYKEWLLNRMGVRITNNYRYPIIFPMYDNGKFVGTLKRTTNAKIESQRKYLYNAGFRRGLHVIGNYYTDWPIVTEGLLDKAKANQNQIYNAVAILGWKISYTQAKKLKSVTNKIVCALDNTPSGEEGYQYLLSLGFEVIRFPFPEHIKDLGEMDSFNFKKSKVKLRKMILNYERRKKNGKRENIDHRFYQKGSGKERWCKKHAVLRKRWWQSKG